MSCMYIMYVCVCVCMCVRVCLCSRHKHVYTSFHMYPYLHDCMSLLLYTLSMHESHVHVFLC